MLTQMGGCRIAARPYGVSESKPEGAPKRSDGGLRVRGHARVSVTAHQIAFWPFARSLAAGGKSTSCFVDDF